MFIPGKDVSPGTSWVDDGVSCQGGGDGQIIIHEDDTVGGRLNLTSAESSMRAMIDFFRTMLTLPRPWVGWVMLLMTVNMIVPLFYLGTLEGRVVLGAALLGAFLQTWIFSAKGFVRLLGVGHIAWIPMVAWLWTRLDVAPAGSLFRYWLLATVVLVSLSLLIDVTDVIRYLRGERAPQLETPT